MDLVLSVISSYGMSYTGTVIVNRSIGPLGMNANHYI